MQPIPKNIVTRFLNTSPKFQNILKEALAQQKKEAATRTIVSDMLAEILGYDKYNDIIFDLIDTDEKRDLVIALNGKHLFPVEIVSVGSELKKGLLRETKIFALDQGLDWVVYTNGIEWHIYRIDPNAALSMEQVLQLNFLKMSFRTPDEQYLLYLLSKEGFRNNAIHAYYQRMQIVNPYTASVMLQEDWVAEKIAVELKKLCPNLLIEPEEITEIILTKVLREEVTTGKAFNNAKFTIQKLSRQS